jgi:endonuclease YncB( thermonuclease family)
MPFTIAMATQGKVILTDVSIADQDGRVAQSVQTGTRISVQSKVMADLGPVVKYVVQIKDSANRVVFLSETSLQIQFGEVRQVETLWQAQKGNHSFQVFVWPDVESPQGFDVSVHSVNVLGAGAEATCGGKAACLRGTVTKVVDGDTIDVSGGVRIRLSLVNTPERGENGYQEATSFTAAICPVGADTIVDEDDGQMSGSYGRVIGKVFCNGELLNQKLLESGNAAILENFCKQSEFGREAWATGFGC